jgi:hypothetical protein
VPVALILPLLGAWTSGSAEERCKFSWGSPKGEAKYTQQLNMDVGDVAGHTIAAYEFHRSDPGWKLPCDGAKVAEYVYHGQSDVIDRNGRSWGYGVVILDNGDKIYSQSSGTRQTEVAADGSSKTIYEGTTIWTGGTGRHSGVRGVERDHGLIEYVAGASGKPEPKTNELKLDGEYWFEK